MKKIFILFSIFLGTILLTGCGKTDKTTLVNKMNKKINNCKGYQVEAELELVNNEDSYKYDVVVSYKKKDKFRVSLMNKTNNHEQIILRNDDGVYVLTPDLNKSFKFQSNWPYNNSQAYLLQSVIGDLKKDSKLKMKKIKNGYVFTSKVNYKNNANLTHQEVVTDKDLNVKSVTVYDNDENALIKVKYKSIDDNAKFKKNYFELEENMEMYSNNEENEENTEVKTTTENETTGESKTTTENETTGENKTTTQNKTTSETMKLEEAIYPMYIPEGTYLDKEKQVSTDTGSRIILTFSGDNPFMLVEQTATREKEFEVIPTSGDIDMFSNGLAIVDTTSVNWTSDNVEYYLVSSSLSKTELLEVAKSVATMPVSK